MKLLFTLFFTLSGILTFAQQNQDSPAKANIYHEEDVYASRVEVEKPNQKVRPLKVEDMPMAVSQVVNELIDNNTKVLTYEVATSGNLSKSYFLAVVSDKYVKKKIYYDKEGKIAKAITLFD